MALNPFGKFKNSLKLDARGSGIPVLFGPVYGNGIWVSIRGDGSVKTSTDGVNWTDGSQISYNGSGTSKFKFLNGKFTFINSGGYIQTSTDAVTWTSYQTKTNNPSIDSNAYTYAIGVRDVTYSNGKYWASVVSSASSVGYLNRVFSSINLTSWDVSYTIPTIPYLQSTDYLGELVNNSGNLIVVLFRDINYSDRLQIFSRDGGASWEIATGDSGITVNNFAYNGTYWLAVGNGGKLISHYNPSTGAGFIQDNWAIFQGPANTTDVNWQAVAYINNKWLISGSKYNTTLARYEPRFYTSTNLLTWTSITVPESSTVNTTETFGAGAFNIATDGTRTITWQYTSTNLTDWTVVNYRIPNQQPYLDYGQLDRYGDWKTMDFWVYIGAVDSAFVQYPIASCWLNSTNYWTVYLSTVGPGGYNPRLTFASSDQSLGTAGQIFSSTGPRTQGDTNNFQGTIVPGQWNHVRIVRNTGVGAIYINGNLDTNSGTTFTAPSGALPHAGNLTIGRIGDGFESYFARNTDYWIDEFTLNLNPLNSPSAQTITVPAERWFSTDTTLLLLHFDYNYLDDSSVPITADSPLVTQAVVQAAATRVIRGSAALAASTTQTVTASRTRQAQAQLSALATELVINARTRGMSIDMAVTANLAALTQKLNGGVAPLTTASQVSAAATKFNGTVVALTSQAQITAEPLRIKTSTVNMTVTGIELAAVVKIAEGYCQAFDVNTTINALAVKTAGGQAALSTQAHVEVTAQKIKNAQANLTAQTTLEADIGKTKEFEAQLATTVSTQAQIKRTAGITLALQAPSTQVAQALRTRNLQATLTAFDTLLAVGSPIRPTQAQLTASTTMLTTTGNIVRAVINLQVQAFELSDVNVIRYDPYYRINIQPETRTHQIHRETRFITIKPETRVNIIKDQL